MTSLYKQFYGDGTRWFIGEVTSIKDPLQLGRVRVQIEGIHHDNSNLIPRDRLPWAQCLVPITEGGTSGYGNNLGIQVGARVFGVFLDGTDSQLPLVMGTLPKYENTTNANGSINYATNNSDVQNKSTNVLATGTNTLVARKVSNQTDPVKIAKDANSRGGEEPFDEPDSPYNAIYPMNYVHETPRGNVIEIDDSHDSDGDGNITDYSRIHIYHRSGSFVEMHPNGDVVTHHKNGFKAVHGNDKVYITGDLDITVNGNMNVTVKGNLTENITGNMDINVTQDITTDGKTINLNSGNKETDGAARLNDTTLDNDTEINGNDTGVITSSSQTVFIGD